MIYFKYSHRKFVTFGGDYGVITRFTRGDYGDYGDDVITSPSVCPYSRFSPELREKWHKERGIADPFKKVVEKKRMEDSVPYKPPKLEPLLDKIQVAPKMKEPAAVIKESEMTKEQRYRAKNKEKLAAKARERRAK